LGGAGELRDFGHLWEMAVLRVGQNELVEKEKSPQQMEKQFQTAKTAKWGEGGWGGGKAFA